MRGKIKVMLKAINIKPPVYQMFNGEQKKQFETLADAHQLNQDLVGFTDSVVYGLVGDVEKLREVVSEVNKLFPSSKGFTVWISDYTAI